MPNRWLDSLKEEVSKHNTTTTSRVDHTLQPIGPAENPQTRQNLTSKTSNTPYIEETEGKNTQTPKIITSKTSNTTNAEHLGLISSWAKEFGYVSIHDPTTGEWHDLPVKEAPGWALGEARRRKELYRSGNYGAYRLTSQKMEELWREEHPPEQDMGIVEDHPVEDEL